MIVLSDSDRGFRARVSEQVGRTDILEADRPATLERIVAEHAGEISVVLMGPSVAPERSLHAAAKIQEIAPEVSVILITATLSSDLLQTALRAGVRDVLPESADSSQVRAAVERGEALWKQLRGGSSSVIDLTEDEEAVDHRTITVFSPKGGVGKSFLAANLAILLAKEHPGEVCLLDLDLQFGDIAIMLQVFPTRTIHEAARNLDHVDADAIVGYTVKHAAGVHVMAAPLEPGLAETISAETARQIIRLLQQRYRYLVIDTPHTFTDHALAALDESDEFVLMATMDVPCIKNLKLSLHTLELLGLNRERIRIVLNRADSKVGLRVGEVEKTIGTAVDVNIPSSRDVPLSINRGSPLVTSDPKSPVAQALVKLAASVTASRSPRADEPTHRTRLARRDR